MQGAPLTLILDVVILVLLGLTIVYAARLSLQLRRLRDSKSDLDRVVRELVKNLDRADRTIGGLKESAREQGGELQKFIDRGIAIADELQLMTDSGDRLADRLEKLVDKAAPHLNNAANNPPSIVMPEPIKQARPPQAAPQQHAPQSQAAAPEAQPQASYAQHLRKLGPDEERAARASFAIRDPEVERGINPLDNKMSLEEDGSGQGLYSEAERDLFRAMKTRGKTKSKGNA